VAEYAASTTLDRIGWIDSLVEFRNRRRADDDVGMLPNHDLLTWFFEVFRECWRIKPGELRWRFWVVLIRQHATLRPPLPVMDPERFGGLGQASVGGEGQKVIPHPLPGLEQVGDLCVLLGRETLRASVPSRL
jgi:hypothetical protein